MRDLWNALAERAQAGTLNREERELARKFATAVKHLAGNPFHPGLHSHEIPDLTKRVARKVFESYLENDTPSAGRLFWVYGPAQRQITLLALEPHPDDSNGAFGRVQLSDMPTPPATLPQSPTQITRVVKRRKRGRS